MLEFEHANNQLIRGLYQRRVFVCIERFKYWYVSEVIKPDESHAHHQTELFRQIAAKLLELNGGNTLQFIEQDDGVINVMDECGDAVGDLVKHNGRFHISFLHTNDNADYLYQIADKLKLLNSDLDS